MKTLFWGLFLGIIGLITLSILTSCAGPGVPTPTYTAEEYVKPTVGYVGAGMNNWHAGSPDYADTSIILDD